MNLTVNKTILKEKYYFKVSLKSGSKTCQVRQFSNEISIKGQISNDGSSIELSKPFKFKGTKKSEERIKEITTLKIPTDKLISVLEVINVS